VSRPGSVKGRRQAPLAGSGRLRQWSAPGTGKPWLLAAKLSRPHAGALRGGAQAVRGLRRMGVTAARWYGPVPGSRLARPPAVAVIGLTLAIHGDLGLTGASTVESAPDLGR